MLIPAVSHTWSVTEVIDIFLLQIVFTPMILFYNIFLNLTVLQPTQRHFLNRKYYYKTHTHICTYIPNRYCNKMVHR